MSLDETVAEARELRGELIGLQKKLKGMAENLNGVATTLHNVDKPEGVFFRGTFSFQKELVSFQKGEAKIEAILPSKEEVEEAFQEYKAKNSRYFDLCKILENNELQLLPKK